MARISRNANSRTTRPARPNWLASSLLALLSPPAQGRVDRPRPGLAGLAFNIILVNFCDDLGYAELGCARGGSGSTTPNIDRLAEEDSRLTRFYSASTVCAPARCAHHDRLPPGAHHPRGNREVGGWGPKPEGRWPLPDAGSLAEVLRRGRLFHRLHRQVGPGRAGIGGAPAQPGLRPLLRLPLPARGPQPLSHAPWRNHDVDVLR
ncbi:MAG: sulfatase-like hydrolase/transferase [Phycisphaerales bacterium]